MKTSDNSIKNNGFPKKVGIVFIDETQKQTKKTLGTLKEFFFKIWPKGVSKPHLNFNQLACIHLLLQMNTIQNIFDFQMIRLEFNKHLSYSTKDHDYHYNLGWFDHEISKFENTKDSRAYDIDYWIGITSEPIEHNWFYLGKSKEQAMSGKAIITSLDWEGVNSPPSLFEYIALSVLMCSLYFINREFYRPLSSHPDLITKGCIYDFTIFKADRRILVSNPHLCSICKERLASLENTIQTQTSSKIAFCEDINKILSRDWMGDPQKRDSPLYNLKKNYGYDIDCNSGFNKKWWEIIRDSVVEKTSEWIVGGIIGVIMLLIGNLLLSMAHLK